MSKRIKMIKRTKHKYKKSSPNHAVNMEIDLERINKQLSQAQYKLDSMIMDSMVPFMPKETGTFINVTREMSSALAGSGKVVAAAPPMGRFLYEGKLMVGEYTRSAFAAKGEKKEVIDKDLDYSKSENPDVQAHWFDAAKAKDGKKWIKEVKHIAGGG